ncbi:MAG: peroxidase-related enzyme [bacterium]|nr:peroxidase-related enzyme [bacterium]
MPHIKVIQPEEATGELKDIYRHLEESRGKIAEVHKIQGLNPESIVKHMELYMTVMFGRSPLKREQREMIAVVVSKANGCMYCRIHHSEAVENYWKDPGKTAQLRDDYTKLELSETDRALCDYAWRLTREPGTAEKEDHTAPLKAVGLSDRSILDATLVIGYFNFVNRIVLGLGVQLEEKPGGYKY